MPRPAAARLEIRSPFAGVLSVEKNEGAFGAGGVPPAGVLLPEPEPVVVIVTT